MVLAHDSPTLDAWGVLFRRNESQTGQIIDRLKNRPTDAGLFRMLGGLRYRKDIRGWKQILGRMNAVITKEQMRESLAVQEWLAEGRQEGRHEGLQEGALREARFTLLSYIKARFPHVDVRDDLTSIQDLDQLHSLFATVVNAPNSAAVRRAIRKAAE